MKDNSIKARAKDIADGIKGGYVPLSSLTSYFQEELEKQQRIDMEKFSIAFCERICGKEKRKDCDKSKKTCTNLANFLKEGTK